MVVLLLQSRLTIESAQFITATCIQISHIRTRLTLDVRALEVLFRLTLQHVCALDVYTPVRILTFLNQHQKNSHIDRRGKQEVREEGRGTELGCKEAGGGGGWCVKIAD